MIERDNPFEPVFFSTVLRGPRLVLIPYSEERDFDHIASLYSNPIVSAAIGIPHPAPYVEGLRQAKRDRMERSDVGDWTALVGTETAGNSTEEAEVFAGEVGIGQCEFRTLVMEVFIAIDPVHAGKGFGREAASLLIEHIFSHVPLATVRMHTLASNRKLLALGMSLGFRETGERWVEADPARGFAGSFAAILDCRIHEFRKYTRNEEPMP